MKTTKSESKPGFLSVNAPLFWNESACVEKKTPPNKKLSIWPNEKEK